MCRNGERRGGDSENDDELTQRLSLAVGAKGDASPPVFGKVPTPTVLLESSISPVLTARSSGTLRPVSPETLGVRFLDRQKAEWPSSVVV